MAFLDRLASLPVRALKDDLAREPIPGELDDIALSASTQRMGWAIGLLAGLLEYLDPSMPRAEWLRVLCGIHHEYFGTPDEAEALDIFDAWSSRGTNYAGRSDVEANWRSLGRRI